MTRLANDELFAVFSTAPDEVIANRTAAAAWSGDGGLAWSPMRSLATGRPHAGKHPTSAQRRRIAVPVQSVSTAGRDR